MQQIEQSSDRVAACTHVYTYCSYINIVGLYDSLHTYIHKGHIRTYIILHDDYLMHLNIIDYYVHNITYYTYINYVHTYASTYIRTCSLLRTYM